ncbi:MAG: D-2-hydroxyacid dehydrogenase [Candidatus Sulfotelmatobacter sp.]
MKNPQIKLLIVIQHPLDLWNVPAWFPEKLRQNFPQVEITNRNNYDGIEQKLRDAEIMFAFSLRPEQLAVARSLRWLHTPTAAVHQLLFPEFVASDVVLTNSSELHGPVVAEHVMALLFALTRKVPQAAVLQQKHFWGSETLWNEGPHPRELAGATLGLVGLGSIGRRVAKIAAALGMRVIAVREHVEKGSPEGVAAVFAPQAIDELLAQSDFVVAATPVTSATNGLFNEARFAAMKPGAYFINVGRGEQVEEAALIGALRSGHIASAALDVFEREPLPANSHLWDVENLLITPHIGSQTEQLWPRHYEVFSENLRRYLAREPLLFVVEKQKGY